MMIFAYMWWFLMIFAYIYNPLWWLPGMMHGPYRATTVGRSLVNGKTLANQPILAGDSLDARIEAAMR